MVVQSTVENDNNCLWITATLVGTIGLWLLIIAPTWVQIISSILFGVIYLIFGAWLVIGSPSLHLAHWHSNVIAALTLPGLFLIIVIGLAITFHAILNSEAEKNAKSLVDSPSTAI